MSKKNESGVGAIQLDGVSETLVASARALCGLYTKRSSLDGSIWTCRATLAPGGVRLEDRVDTDAAELVEVVSYDAWLAIHESLAPQGFVCSCLYGDAS